MLIRLRYLAAPIGAALLAAVLPPAQADGMLDFRQVVLCKTLKDNTARLQCFDRALSNAPSAGADDFKIVEVESDWQISESRSPADDSLRLAAVLPAVEGTAALVMRCDRVTEVYFNLRTYIGGVEPLPITYRFGDGPSTETRWLPSREGGAVFAGTPTLAIAFARSLPDDTTLYLKVRDFQGRTTDLTFKLGPVSDVRSKIAAACRWPEPSSTPATAAPAATPAAAPATRPGPATLRVVKHRHVPTNQQRWNVGAQR